LPKLRIWADGRVVISNDFSNVREVEFGSLESSKIDEILNFLKDVGFFSNWTPAPASPSGSYFHLTVNVKAGSFSQGSGDPMEPIITRICCTNNINDLKPFSLKLPNDGQRPPRFLFGPPIPWPSQFGFILQE